MFKVMNEFKRVDSKPNKKNNTVNSKVSSLENEVEEVKQSYNLNNGPTFFL